MADSDSEKPWISHRLPDGTPVARPRKPSPGDTRPDQGWMEFLGWTTLKMIRRRENGEGELCTVFPSREGLEDPVPVYVPVGEWRGPRKEGS